MRDKLFSKNASSTCLIQKFILINMTTSEIMKEISQRHSTDGREPRALVKEFSSPYRTVRVVNEDRAPTAP